MSQSIIKPSSGKALLIDGKAASAAVIERVAREAGALAIKPGLAVVLVGEDPASQVYVKSKGKAAHSCGVMTDHTVAVVRLPTGGEEAQPASASTDALMTVPSVFRAMADCSGESALREHLGRILMAVHLIEIGQFGFKHDSGPISYSSSRTWMLRKSPWRNSLS